MTTIVKMHEDDFMNLISNAIMTTALRGKDTQIIHDGIYLNLEEVFCREFIRGYVIPYDDESMKMPDPDSKDFTKWLAGLLYLHSNKCVEYFEINKNFTFDFTEGDIISISQKNSNHKHDNDSYGYNDGVL